MCAAGQDAVRGKPYYEHTATYSQEKNHDPRYLHVYRCNYRYHVDVDVWPTFQRRQAILRGVPGRRIGVAGSSNWWNTGKRPCPHRGESCTYNKDEVPWKGIIYCLEQFPPVSSYGRYPISLCVLISRAPGYCFCNLLLQSRRSCPLAVCNAAERINRSDAPPVALSIRPAFVREHVVDEWHCGYASCPPRPASPCV